MKTNENTGKYISYLARLILQYTSEQFSKYDLTVIEYTYLMILMEKKKISQNELAKLSLVDKSQTTRAIKSLESKAFIKKEQSENDRRAYFISLSNKGKKMAPIVKSEINAFESLLNEGITIEEQRIMKKNLLRMIKNIRGEQDE